jgi:hypothetical protein
MGLQLCLNMVLSLSGLKWVAFFLIHRLEHHIWSGIKGYFFNRGRLELRMSLFWRLILNIFREFFGALMGLINFLLWFLRC